MQQTETMEFMFLKRSMMLGIILEKEKNKVAVTTFSNEFMVVGALEAKVVVETKPDSLYGHFIKETGNL